MADGLALKAAVQDKANSRALVIGSGFIGLEVVEALVHQGKEVRLIELAERVIPDAFDGEITQHIETELREQGVSLHLGERVEALLGEGRVTGVRTSHGEYEADIVVVCTGVKYRVSGRYRHRAARQRRHQGGSAGRSSLANVWSAGDCASVWHVKQQQVYVPLATIANKLGRMVGEPGRCRAGVPAPSALPRSRCWGWRQPYRSFRAAKARWASTTAPW
jgi:NADPH-dependent 2,4-dienoyl-CoA reductase/sulfur reductase-like enzyme